MHEQVTREPDARERGPNELGPNELGPNEPAWLQRSLDRYYTAGLAFMLVLIIGFPLYRLREPGLRAHAKTEQATTYKRLGADLFQQGCAQCHGANAAGGGSGPTLNAKQFLAATSDGQIGLVISGGVPGSSMAAWSLDYGGPLTDEQIRQLVTYLRSLEPQAPSIPGWRTGAKAA